MQWGNVLGLSTNPTYSNTVTIGSITNQFTHQVWVDGCGNTVLDAWSEIGGPHGTDANLNAQYVIPFLGLDKVGPVDPEDPDVYCGHAQRGRPHLNAARTTFVADNGQRLARPIHLHRVDVAPQPMSPRSRAWVSTPCISTRNRLI